MFPFSEEIKISANLQVHYSLVLKVVGQLLTEERRERIRQVLPHRNFSNPVVLESIYDRGNISAVMRSCEALGLVNFHVIETQEKFKEANRVTQGSDKWVETTKWKSTAECVRHLRSQGCRIVGTFLSPQSRPIAEIDFSVPTALVLGNEKEGLSQEMQGACDELAILPMYGFVQSFNISVAGALSVYQITQDRLHRLGKTGDLSEEQQAILAAHYYIRTQESALDILRRQFLKGQG